MFQSVAKMPVFLAGAVIVSLVLCKYFYSPKIFLLIVILVSIFYQKNMNKTNDKTYNLEDKLINNAKFIIITGFLGYIVVRIIGIFFPVLAK
jgi:hypothetical protein